MSRNKPNHRRERSLQWILSFWGQRLKVTRKWKDILCSCIGKINIMKIIFLFYQIAIYIFNVILIQIPISFFTELKATVSILCFYLSNILIEWNCEISIHQNLLALSILVSKHTYITLYAHTHHRHAVHTYTHTHTLVYITFFKPSNS